MEEERLGRTPRPEENGTDPGQAVTEVIPPELAPFLDRAGRLTALPAKHKKKLAALWYLAGKIPGDRPYTEPEINALLDAWTGFHDPATLRRELYNKQLLDRTADGRAYQKAASIPAFGEFMEKYI